MRSESTVSVESNRSAATLYATGELTTAAALQAIARADQLPDNIRALCVDLRGVQRADPDAMRALETALGNWRASRRGMSSVKLPENAETSSVALRFAHQRWAARED